jgi:hypothetical protein
VLAPGETGEVGTTGPRLRFQGVTGDSRCPAGALCIQGGDAIVRIDVLQKSGGLSPYPFSSLPPIAPGDYRATLRVTR